MFERWCLLGSAMLVAACTTAQISPDSDSTIGQTLAPDDPVIRVAQTIDRVADLEANGAVTATDYLGGIRALRTSGARLADGEDAATAANTYEAQWLAAARVLDPAAAIPPLRGRVLGPAYKRGTVRPGSQQVTTQLFLAGKKAKVALAGPASSARQAGLRLEIRQSNGDPVCVRPAGSASTGCEWIPLFSGRYEITVANSGPSAQQYVLVSN